MLGMLRGILGLHLRPVIVRAPSSRAQRLKKFKISLPKGPFRLGSPPPGRGVKTLPGSKSKKKSPGESPRGSPGLLANPPKTSQKRVSRRLCESKITCFLTPETRFDSLWGGRPGPSETPLETLPNRTKTSTAPESVVFCCCRSFSVYLYTVFLPLFPREKQALLSTIRSVLLLA